MEAGGTASPNVRIRIAMLNQTQINVVALNSAVELLARISTYTWTDDVFVCGCVAKPSHRPDSIHECTSLTYDNVIVGCRTRS